MSDMTEAEYLADIEYSEMATETDADRRRRERAIDDADADWARDDRIERSIAEERT